MIRVIVIHLPTRELHFLYVLHFVMIKAKLLLVNYRITLPSPENFMILDAHLVCLSHLLNLIHQFQEVLNL
jgi:hypothetical protein